MHSFTTSWKAAWQCDSPPSCCTSTSCLLAAQQLSVVKMYFSHLLFTPLPALIDMHTSTQEPMNLCIIWPITAFQSEMFSFCGCLSSISAVRSLKVQKKKKDSRKQTGGNSSFKCSKLISARQDLITQPSLLQLTSVQRLTGKTQFLNYLICVIWCFYFLFSLVSESEGEGFSKFVLGSRAAQEELHSSFTCPKFLFPARGGNADHVGL